MPVLLVHGLRTRYGITGIPTDEDLRRMADGLGVEVVPLPNPGRLVGVFCDGALGVPPNLPRVWWRWLVARACILVAAGVGHGEALTDLDGKFLVLAAGALLWGSLLGAGYDLDSLSCEEIAVRAAVPLYSLVAWQLARECVHLQCLRQIRPTLRYVPQLSEVS